MGQNGIRMDGVGIEEVKEKALEVLGHIQGIKINIDKGERWVSTVMGGGLLLYGIKRRSWGGLILGLLGGGLLLRGVLGRSLFFRMIGINTATGEGLPWADSENGIIRVDKALVIDRTAEELFNYLRDVANFTSIFHHLKSVRSLDRKRSVWTARMPAGLDLVWETEVWDERQNKKIAWRTTPTASLNSDGAFIFDSLGKGERTQVGIHLEYEVPTGKIGKAFAKLFGKHPDRLIDEELHRFKTFIEAELSR